MKKREHETLRRLLTDVREKVEELFHIDREVNWDDLTELSSDLGDILSRMDDWERQKWPAAIDEVNMTRIDAEPVRLVAA